jgi:hypothetical protein
MQFWHAYKKGAGAMPIWAILVVVPVAVLLGTVLLASKNGASGRPHSSAALSETEGDYKARQDLIPKLEETLKVYTFNRREGPGNVAVAFSGVPGTRATGDQIP